MLVTRSSHCKQGGMACVLVQPDASRNNIYDSIIGVSTNLPLYSENDSDVHAEVAALGKASRKGRATEKATAYITMPPCKKCFAALMVSGISRIVTRVTAPKQIEQAATKNGIEVVTLEGVEQQRERINIIIHGNPEGKRSLEDKEEIEERRKRRKEERQQRKNKNNETPT
jgi:tRNA(Arg) A34 adenosine deaminase TadA